MNRSIDDHPDTRQPKRPSDSRGLVSPGVTSENRTDLEMKATKPQSTLEKIFAEAKEAKQKIKEAQRLREDKKMDESTYSDLIQSYYEKAQYLTQLKERLLATKKDVRFQIMTLRGEVIDSQEAREKEVAVTETQEKLQGLMLKVADENDSNTSNIVKILERTKKSEGKMSSEDKLKAGDILKRYKTLGEYFTSKTVLPDHPLYKLLNTYRALVRLVQDQESTKKPATLPSDLPGQLDFFSDIDNSGTTGDDIKREVKGGWFRARRIEEKLGNEIGEQNLRNMLGEYATKPEQLQEIIKRLTNGKDILAKNAKIVEIRQEFISVLTQKMRYFGALTQALSGIKDLPAEHARAGLAAIISGKEDVYFSRIVAGMSPEELGEFRKKHGNLIPPKEVDGGFGIPLLFLHYSHTWYDAYDGKKGSLKTGEGEVTGELFYRAFEVGAGVNLNDRANAIAQISKGFAKIIFDCINPDTGLLDTNAQAYKDLNKQITEKKFTDTEKKTILKSITDVSGFITKTYAKIDNNKAFTPDEKKLKKQAVRTQMQELIGREMLGKLAESVIRDGRKFSGISGVLNILGTAAAVVVGGPAGAGIFAASTGLDIGTQKMERRHTASRPEDNVAMEMERQATNKPLTEQELAGLRSETVPTEAGKKYVYAIKHEIFKTEAFKRATLVYKDVNLESDGKTIKSEVPLVFEVTKMSTIRGVLKREILVRKMNDSEFEEAKKATVAKVQKKQAETQTEIDAAAKAASERMKGFDTKKMKEEVKGIMEKISSTEIRTPALGFMELQRQIMSISSKPNLSIADADAALQQMQKVKNNKGQTILATVAGKYLSKGVDLATKMALLNVVLQETAGDWRIRTFNKIKEKGTNERKLFVKNFFKVDDESKLSPKQKTWLDKLSLGDIMNAWTRADGSFNTKLGEFGLTSEEVQYISNKRDSYTAERNLTELKEIPSTITKSGVLAFTSFSQVRRIDGKLSSKGTAQGIAPLVGDVELLAEPIELKDRPSKNIQKKFLEKTPDWVLQSWFDQAKAAIKKFNNTPGLSKKIDDITNITEFRQYLLGEKKQGDLFSADMTMSYGRFARCGNDVYMLKPKLIVDGKPVELKTGFPQGTGTDSVSAQGGVRRDIVDQKGAGPTIAGVRVANGESVGNVLGRTDAHAGDSSGQLGSGISGT